jgi:hypothetical protein
VEDNVFVALYVTEACKDARRSALRLKEYAKLVNARMTVFYNGTDAELPCFCSKNDIPLHMAHEKPGRAEMMRRAVYLAEGGIFVWLEEGVVPLRNDWLHALTCMNGTTAAGVVRWSKLNAPQMELVASAPWFTGMPPQKFKFDLNVHKVYHFERGLFAASAKILERLGWPDMRVPDAELDVLFGEALRQQGVELKNVGDVAEFL